MMPNDQLIPDSRPFGFIEMRRELEDLLSPSLIGTYNAFSVYEIVGVPRGGTPINVLTIAVAEAIGIEGTVFEEPAVLLNTDRIKLKELPGWNFCVSHCVRPIDSVHVAVEQYQSEGAWMLSGKELGMGQLKPTAPVFAAANSSDDVPINAILKNNFWGGSHVLRLCDQNKERFTRFFEDRQLIQSLSNYVQQYLPMHFAQLADFLGDVVIQIPVSVVDVQWHVESARGPVTLSATWRPGIEPRPLAATIRAAHDTTLVATGFVSGFIDSAVIDIDIHGHPLEMELWDQQTGRLLFASVPTGHMLSAELRPLLNESEPRLFTTSASLNKPERAARVAVIHHLPPMRVGVKSYDVSREWRARRTQLEEANRLAESRDFVQYYGGERAPSDRDRAMDDLRLLITRHGAAGVDLWDPYLSAADLLETLFWAPSSQAPLRAITNGSEAKEQQLVSDYKDMAYVQQQQAVLDKHAGNRFGLNLQYKIRSGPQGWSFHDRFVIFPNHPSGPLAWSLGTSINSLGTAHHVLQKVSNAAMIARSFQDLWTALDQNEHTIWSST
ncbi:VPA1262 family N-terminal domain-containing protein [Pseudomonas syringae group sp. 26L6]|uniref:VPA1262 family N-terminal domain-containing protein n=1 Tax=Pseudomonas syringae group sp. 26L6 TaxID=3079591 RepID=UPI0029126F6A|nr:VPA1262 family N-terminal domain-containing protein [Pseudomonas syringae group sp. 26L6]MDU8644381.1 VPA1262 family N-terminal domain-containing protein [Pseudomonas syringae group sp. 26L6]